MYAGVPPRRLVILNEVKDLLLLLILILLLF